MTETATARPISGKAVVSLVLGMLSLFLTFVTGVPALIVGFRGLREINQSDGRMGGRGLAIAGMALGTLGSCICVGWLLVIVITRARESAQRAGCLNHLRQMGMAIRMYHDNHDKTYPPGTMANDRLRATERLSWMASVLPYYTTMDADNRKADPSSSMYYSIVEGLHKDEAWDAKANADAVNRVLRGFLCPADPAYVPPGEPGLTQYVGMAGLGQDAPRLKATDSAAGFFGYDRVIGPRDVKGEETTTMMVTETGHNIGPWAAGGSATVRGLDTGDEPYLGRGRQFGGFHQGLVNILYVDGSARPFREDASPAMFEMLIPLNRPASDE
jgi:prepilin-type processing-associated H-X9-DG protein